MNKTKPQTRPDAKLNLRMPSPKAWSEGLQECGLSKQAETLLAKICADAVQDARAYQSFCRGRISRPEKIARLERLRDGLLPLRCTIQAEGKRLSDLVPLECLERLGRAFSLEGIRSAREHAAQHKSGSTDKDAPKGRIEELLEDQATFTIAEAEAFTAMTRADHGLTRSDRLVTFVIDTLLDPVERALEMLKEEKGGRPPLVIRRHFLHKIIKAAPQLTAGDQKPPTLEKLVLICAMVLPLFGVPALGIAKAVKAMVREIEQTELTGNLADAV